MSHVTSTNWTGSCDQSQNYIGKGTLTFSNNDTFKGVIDKSVNDIWDGKGFYTYKNGDTYKGDFIRCKRHGEGLYTWPNSKENYFRGKWEQDNMISGFFSCSEYTYNGDIKNNKKEGKGIITYKLNVGTHTYEGDWKNNKRHGKGKSVKHGRTYEGEWEDDLPHGIGVQNFDDGREWSGKWVKGVLQNGEFKGKLKTSTSIPKLPLI